MNDHSKVAITGIQRFTVRDGPGVRTTIFFKGCTLRCKWCHNPETISPASELVFHSAKCIGCGACAAVCPRNKFVKGVGEAIFGRQCADCGKCARSCPVSAIAFAAEYMTVDEIVEKALRDRVFYRDGGGVTLSGGEPLLQTEQPEILRRLRENGVHTAIDTALNVPWKSMDIAMQYADLFLVDIKAIDTDLHRELTGADNIRILENLRRLAGSGANIWIRTPVIPGLNDGELPAIADFVRSLGREDILVELIPYHSMGMEKYAALGKPVLLRGIEPPDAAQMERYYQAMKGLKRVEYLSV